MERTSPVKEIDGASYEVMPMPVDPSTELFFRIGKVLGPALAEAKGVSLEAKVNVQLLGPMAARLLMSADPKEVQAIYKKAFEYVRRDGVPLDKTYTVMFSGKLATMVKVLGHFLRVTYGDFFELLTVDEQQDAQQK